MHQISLALTGASNECCNKVIGDLPFLFSEYLIAYNRALRQLTKEGEDVSTLDLMKIRKIRIIQFMREQVGLSLLEAKVLVESFGDINVKLRAAQMTAQIKFD